MLMTALESLGRGVAASTLGASTWLPVRASSQAGDVDWIFYFIYYLSLAFFALIVGLMVFFVIRYRRRRAGDEAESQTSHNTPLETVWSIIPLIVVIVIFWLGFKGFLALRVVPQDAYEIRVTAQKWSWQFSYPGGHEDNELHVPVNRPVRLLMNSLDVIHSLFVPAFRVKMDVVPGRYTDLWFRATEPGEYMLYCTEYCGTSHSDMLAKVVVHEPGAYEVWLEDASNILGKYPPEEAGRILVEKRGCQTCHSSDGTAATGPSFLGLFGREESMKDGSIVTADENYIRNSILEPQAQIVAGYEGVMPTYQGRLKDDEIGAIIEYIKTLEP